MPLPKGPDGERAFKVEVVIVRENGDRTVAAEIAAGQLVNPGAARVWNELLRGIQRVIRRGGMSY